MGCAGSRDVDHNGTTPPCTSSCPSDSARKYQVPPVDETANAGKRTPMNPRLPPPSPRRMSITSTAGAGGPPPMARRAPTPMGFDSLHSRHSAAGSVASTPRTGRGAYEGSRRSNSPYVHSRHDGNMTETEEMIADLTTELPLKRDYLWMLNVQNSNNQSMVSMMSQSFATTAHSRCSSTVGECFNAARAWCDETLAAVAQGSTSSECPGFPGFTDCPSPTGPSNEDWPFAPTGSGDAEDEVLTPVSPRTQAFLDNARTVVHPLKVEA